MVWIFEDSSKVGLGGGQHVTASVIRALRDQRVRLIDSSTTLLRVARTHHPELRFSLVPFRGKSVRATSSFSFPASEIPLTAWQLVRAVFRTAGLVRRERPDVLYCPSRKGFVLAVLLRSLLGRHVPIVYHAHTALPDRAMSSVYVRLVARSAHVVLCVSTFVLEQMRGRRLLLPNPLALQASTHRRDPSDRPVVAFVGSDQPIKGFDVFVDVARAYGDRYRFVAFMREPTRETPPIEIRTGLGPTEIYPMIDVLLICSRAPESFGLVALEASAFNVPIVFPPQPALLEFLVPGVSGEVYAEHTVDAIGETLERVVGDLQRYRPDEVVDWSRFDPGRFEAAIRRVLLTC